METVYDNIMPIVNDTIEKAYDRYQEEKSHEMERQVLVNYCLNKISEIAKIDIQPDDTEFFTPNVLIEPPH